MYLLHSLINRTHSERGWGCKENRAQGWWAGCLSHPKGTQRVDSSERCAAPGGPSEMGRACFPHLEPFEAYDSCFFFFWWPAKMTLLLSSPFIFPPLDLSLWCQGPGQKSVRHFLIKSIYSEKGCIDTKSKFHWRQGILITQGNGLLHQHMLGSFHLVTSLWFVREEIDCIPDVP